jgi:hypothetical protein
MTALAGFELHNVHPRIAQENVQFRNFSLDLPREM